MQAVTFFMNTELMHIIDTRIKVTLFVSPKVIYFLKLNFLL